MNDNFTEGYDVGYLEGQHHGYNRGYEDAVKEYELRLARYWGEIATLNARISHIEKMFDSRDNND